MSKKGISFSCSSCNNVETYFYELFVGHLLFIVGKFFFPFLAPLFTVLQQITPVKEFFDKCLNRVMAFTANSYPH